MKTNDALSHGKAAIAGRIQRGHRCHTDFRRGVLWQHHFWLMFDYSGVFFGRGREPELNYWSFLGGVCCGVSCEQKVLLAEGFQTKLELPLFAVAGKEVAVNFWGEGFRTRQASPGCPHHLMQDVGQLNGTNYAFAYFPSDARVDEAGHGEQPEPLHCACGRVWWKRGEHDGRA